MSTKFESALATDKQQASITGGFGSGGKINPGKWATELYKGEMSGPWLCCYMLRRFGWPNEGSDDYKNLMSWTLTTPMAGLYLCVTPYLGHGGTPKEAAENAKYGCANLHFGVRFSKVVGENMERDPVRDRFFERQQNMVRRWWKTKGRAAYTFGCGKVSDADETLVHEYGKADEKKHPGMVWGLWKRIPEHDKFKANDKWLKNGMALWWLSDFVDENHKEVRFPRMTKRERAERMTPFQIQVRSAIKATLKDLLRPTNVRDISFTPFGDIERTPEAVKRYSNQPQVRYFVGAGNTPEYWFTSATAKEKSGAI